LKNTFDNTIENIALRSAAVLQYSNVNVTNYVKHKMFLFFPLIVANSRFMNKIANTYG